MPPVVMNPLASGLPSSDAIIPTASRSIESVPASDSSAHSTKNRPGDMASMRRLIDDGMPEYVIAKFFSMSNRLLA